MPTQRQLRVIAHRGASGYLPEHTLAAKSLAYGLGADFLEQDLMATRDHQLVVLHDIFLNDISDVARVFPDRKRADGYHYVLDFDLIELRQLSLVERRRPNHDDRLYPARFAFDVAGFGVVTLEEEIKLVQGLNATTGKQVGIYPEIKDPQWHHDNGIDVGVLLAEQLAQFGYDSLADPIFVQCFDASELKRLRTEIGIDLPLIQLLDNEAAANFTSTSQVEEMAAYAQGVGLPYATLLESTSEENAVAHGTLGVGGAMESAVRPSALHRLLSASDLAVHPYTFRQDRLRAPWTSFERLVAYFIRELKVDALFTDHPDVVVRVRERLA